MQFTRSQLIILGTAVFLVLLFAGIFTGVLPGTRQFRQKPPEISLKVWGVDPQEYLLENINAYEALRPNVRVDYEELNPQNYEQTVINALAAGTGPDVIMFHNSWLPKHYNKLAPLSETQLNLKTFKETFPAVVEQDFAPDGKIRALPLYIDTLALFYNQDTFDKVGIAVTPEDWLDFQNLIPKLRQKDSAGRLTKPAAAIGGSERTIDKSADLLMLLMLQAGAKMTDDEFIQATFSSNVAGTLPGIDALNFYTKFSDPKDIYYTWNDGLDYSLDSFAKGETAMIFNYAEQKRNLREKNPFLSFKTAEMPQPTGAEKAVNYPNYFGLAVTNNSKAPDWAWDLILYLTANDTAAENYLKAANRPPALRSLIQKYTNHPELGVFAKQALSARSWPQIDQEKIRAVFSAMIQAVASGQLEAQAAAAQAEREVTELMKSRR